MKSINTTNDNRSSENSLSIMLFITSTKHRLLEQTLLSIQQQRCKWWELTLITPNNEFFYAYNLDVIIQSSPIKQINILVSALPPHKLAHKTQCKYISYIASGDILHKDFVSLFSRQQQNTPSLRFFYSDHSLLPKNTPLSKACFKPDWNPDYLYSYNYIARAAVFYRDDLIHLDKTIFNKKQNYFHQLILSITQHYHEDEIHHFASILFHFHPVEMKRDSISSANYFLINSAAHIPIRTKKLQLPSRDKPLVSIIIPTKNQVELLKQCISSLLAKTAYPCIELLIIDNQSDNPEALSYLEQLSSEDNIQILHYPRAFNYSAINNFAVKQAKGSLIALLNNDIKITTSNWLSEMVAHALRPEIGCVGAKLYYPDGTIQHGGVILGIKGTASHAHKYFPKDHSGYCNRLSVVHNVSAVTAACLVMRKDLFEEVGGFDEVNLKVAYNDVDLCLKVLALGYRNLWTPDAELIHYESKSRGKKRSWWQRRKLRKEARFLQQKWGKLLLNDPCYNPNLTLDCEDFSPKKDDE